jgi:hypothetical protein
MGYDAMLGKTVLFGGCDDIGCDSNGVQADTWEYDGTNWNKKTLTKASPPARYFASMVYDSARGRIVLFGGVTAAGAVLDDTWEYDGTNWTPIAPMKKPHAREQAAMVYDSARGRTVLFGGLYSATPINDTWEYDGANWMQITPATMTPPARTYAMMVDMP